MERLKLIILFLNEVAYVLNKTVVANNEEKYSFRITCIKEKFGERTLKICVDGNFTCPNRDGTLAYGGCIYCSEKGSGELIKKCDDISLQVRNFLNSYKADRANKFIVYFLCQRIF